MPGSFEIPLVAKSMAKSGKFDVVLTLGAVVRPLHMPQAFLHQPEQDFSTKRMLSPRS